MSEVKMKVCNKGERVWTFGAGRRVRVLRNFRVDSL